MRKILLTIVFFLIGSAACLAGPFLVCSPVSSDTVSHYRIKVDGGAAITVPAFGNPDGSVMIHYDLAGFSNGNHNLSIAAANIWGESTYVPFQFAKAVPSGPQNFQLSSE
jgi:hypothetical protein